MSSLSVTSTSKAVACAVISTAGSVAARPTAQTTTSARALVSGGRVVLPPPPSDGRPPFPSPPSAGITGGRGGLRHVTRRPGPGEGAGVAPSPAPRGAPRAADEQERGCRSAADADGTRRSPRPRAAFPRSARGSSGRLAALPPRLRAAPPAPSRPEPAAGAGRRPGPSLRRPHAPRTRHRAGSPRGRTPGALPAEARRKERGRSPDAPGTLAVIPCTSAGGESKGAKPARLGTGRASGGGPARTSPPRAPRLQCAQRTVEMP